jgi:acyl carrier protein
LDDAEISAVVTEEWRRVLNTANTDPHADFFEFGGNSLTAAELMAAVEERTGITFPIEILFMDGTFGELVRACTEAVGHLSN